jgi:hypothetical protein
MDVLGNNGGTRREVGMGITRVVGHGCIVDGWDQARVGASEAADGVGLGGGMTWVKIADKSVSFPRGLSLMRKINVFYFFLKQFLWI